jgi:ATP-dependent Clp protease ATP-binding subunit ClpC
MPAMYECFTNRACVVMQMANEEARRFNHTYVGTEHVLLGLVKEGVRTRSCPGVAAKVLREFDILHLRKIRVEVHKIVHSGADVTTKHELPHTPQVNRVIESAIQEADRLNLPDIGTGFLLLGLLREREGVAAQVLMNLGLKLEDMRKEVLRFLVRAQ